MSILSSASVVDSRHNADDIPATAHKSHCLSTEKDRETDNNKNTLLIPTISTSEIHASSTGIVNSDSNTQQQKDPHIHNKKRKITLLESLLASTNSFNNNINNSTSAIGGNINTKNDVSLPSDHYSNKLSIIIVVYIVLYFIVLNLRKWRASRLSDNNERRNEVHKSSNSLSSSSALLLHSLEDNAGATVKQITATMKKISSKQLCQKSWATLREAATSSCTLKHHHNIRGTEEGQQRLVMFGSTEPFVSLDIIAKMTLVDVSNVFRYVIESNKESFNMDTFKKDYVIAGESSTGVMNKVIEAINVSTSKSLGTNFNNSLSTKVRGSDDKYFGNIDALQFCAAVRIFAEWRILRQIPDGYKAYAFGLNLGKKDLITNIGKIETAVHSYLQGPTTTTESPTIRQLLQYELDNDVHKRLPKLKDKTSAIGILWIVRQIQYQICLNDNMLQVSTTSTSPKAIDKKFHSSSSAALHAYEHVYSNYHGWTVQNIFKYSLKGAPKPIEIYKAMNPHHLTKIHQQQLTTTSTTPTTTAANVVQDTSTTVTEKRFDDDDNDVDNENNNNKESVTNHNDESQQQKEDEWLLYEDDNNNKGNDDVPFLADISQSSDSFSDDDEDEKFYNTVSNINHCHTVKTTNGNNNQSKNTTTNNKDDMNPFEKFGNHIGKEWDKFTNDFGKNWEKFATGFVNIFEHNDNIHNDNNNNNRNINRHHHHNHERLRHNSNANGKIGSNSNSNNNNNKLTRTKTSATLSVSIKQEELQQQKRQQEKQNSKVKKCHNDVIITEEDQINMNASSQITESTKVIQPLLKDLVNLLNEFNMNDPTKV